MQIFSHFCNIFFNIKLHISIWKIAQDSCEELPGSTTLESLQVTSTSQEYMTDNNYHLRNDGLSPAAQHFQDDDLCPVEEHISSDDLNTTQ